MSHLGDDGSDMPGIWLDDDTIEALVDGDGMDSRSGPLAGFAQAVRTLGDGPAPPVSSALEALFAGRVESGPVRRRGRIAPTQRVRTIAARVAALGIAAKVGLGAAVAGAGVAGAGAAGALPGGMDRQVRGAIEVMTPVDFEDPTTRHGRARFGERVSSDATGSADGDNGVDGQQISDEAPGAAHRPTDPGRTGRDRASQTPAAEHLPEDPQDDSDDPSSSPPTGPPSSRPAAIPSTVPVRGGDDG